MLDQGARGRGCAGRRRGVGFRRMFGLWRHRPAPSIHDHLLENLDDLRRWFPQRDWHPLQFVVAVDEGYHQRIASGDDLLIQRVGRRQEKRRLPEHDANFFGTVPHGFGEAPHIDPMDGGRALLARQIVEVCCLDFIERAAGDEQGRVRFAGNVSFADDEVAATMLFSLTEDVDQAGDPARAFEDLRAEVAVIRRAVQALPGAWEEKRPPDYSPDLGHITKGLAAVAAQLDAINQHPALTMTPEQHRQAIAQAGSGLMREAVQKLDQAIRDAERERQQLAGLIGATRRQDEQRNWLIYTGLAAFVVALLLSPFLYAALPFGLSGRIAALVMNTDRWNAGEALMRAGNPDGWNGAVNAWNLVRANQKEIAACSVEAAKAKKDQHCTITVPDLEQGN